jgi:hypothetical protein
VHGIILGLLIWCGVSIPTSLLCGALLHMAGRHDDELSVPRAPTREPQKKRQVGVVGNSSA